jgi:D-alanyl-D-alanine carboxypeptidase
MKHFVKHSAIDRVCNYLPLVFIAVFCEVHASQVSAQLDSRELSKISSSQVADFLQRNPVPGVVIGVIAEEGVRAAIAAGQSDPQKQQPMPTSARMLAGSTGKTFFAAAAMRLVEDGKLDLDVPISTWLGAMKIPNGELVTTRMLLSHRSGFPEYDQEFMEALIAEPLRERTSDDWLGPIRRSSKPGVPGKDFRYSDLNFVVLAMVLEAAAGEPTHSLIDRLFLTPFQLKDTFPASSSTLDGLVPGFEGKGGLFGKDRVLIDGKLVFNPQFEWGGGGYVSTAEDLTTWISALRENQAVSGKSWTMMTTPTSVSGEGNAYGLGIHIDPTPLGIAYGHSGYIPGYLSWVRWYEFPAIGIAAQINSSDPDAVRDDGYDLLNGIAKQVVAAGKYKNSESTLVIASLIEASMERLDAAELRNEVDALINEMNPDVEMVDVHGFAASRNDIRSRKVREWQATGKPIAVRRYIEKIKCDDAAAEVDCVHFREADSRPDGSGNIDRLVTVRRTREKWTVLDGSWKVKSIHELTVADSVDCKPGQ